MSLATILMEKNTSELIGYVVLDEKGRVISSVADNPEALQNWWDQFRDYRAGLGLASDWRLARIAYRFLEERQDD